MPRQGIAVWPPMPTEEEMTIPRLSHNGTIIEGWVKAPTGKVWEPQGGDLIWLPPNATKATDIDGIGRVVDVGPWDIGDTMAWVKAQIAKANRYAEYVKEKVRAGQYRMTAGWMRAHGFDEDEIARLTGAELTPRTAPISARGAAGAYKAMADLEAAIARTSMASDPFADPHVKAIAQKAVERYVMAGGDFEAGRAAAADEVLRAVRARGGQPS